jgi:hypothetical protein
MSPPKLNLMEEPIGAAFAAISEIFANITF